MSFNFDFNEDELDLIKAVGPANRPSSGNKRFPAYRDTLRLGTEVKFAKIGKFTLMLPGKKGNMVEKLVRKIKGVVLGMGFYREKWGKQDNKPKFLCGTVEHKTGNNADGTPKMGNGMWQWPSMPDRIDNAMNPIGMQLDDNGAFLSCLDCKQLGKSEGCVDKGFIYFAVLGYWDDEEEEFIDLKTPVILTLNASPKTNGRGINEYREELKSSGYSMGQVVTVLGTKPLEKLTDISYLTFTQAEPLDDENLKAAIATAFEGAKTSAKEASDARKAEWKARQTNNKPAVAAGAKKVPAGNLDDDSSEFNW